jgi:hypothetical protein
MKRMLLHYLRAFQSRFKIIYAELLALEDREILIKLTSSISDTLCAARPPAAQPHDGHPSDEEHHDDQSDIGE